MDNQDETVALTALLSNLPRGPLQQGQSSTIIPDRDNARQRQDQYRAMARYFDQLATSLQEAEEPIPEEPPTTGPIATTIHQTIALPKAKTPTPILTRDPVHPPIGLPSQEQSCKLPQPFSRLSQVETPYYPLDHVPTESSSQEPGQILTYPPRHYSSSTTKFLRKPCS
jgi:hypothetical protein